MALTDPIAATFVNSTTFTATTDAAGNTDLRDQCAIGVRVKANCGTDGYKYGVVSAVSYSAPTTTIQITGDALTSNLVSFWHGNDNRDALVNHGHSGPADGGLIGTATPTANAHPIADALGKLTAWIGSATDAVAGIVQLATNAIALAGTDAAKAVTPAGLAFVAQAEGWGQFDDFFESNGDGDLMPSTNPISSRNFTLNADGDIQPDAA